MLSIRSAPLSFHLSPPCNHSPLRAHNSPLFSPLPSVFTTPLYFHHSPLFSPLSFQVDCPEDTATYIHRVGRTARYVAAGKALMFLLPSEHKMVEKLGAAQVRVYGGLVWVVVCMRKVLLLLFVVVVVCVYVLTCDKNESNTTHPHPHPPPTLHHPPSSPHIHPTYPLLHPPHKQIPSTRYPSNPYEATLKNFNPSPLPCKPSWPKTNN